jgi:hypothetical protein
MPSSLRLEARWAAIRPGLLVAEKGSAARSRIVDVMGGAENEVFQVRMLVFKFLLRFAEGVRREKVSFVVDLLNSTSVPFDVPRTTTIHEVLEVLEEHTGLNPMIVRLIRMGRPVAPELTLDEAGVEDGNKLYYIIAMRPG